MSSFDEDVADDGAFEVSSPVEVEQDVEPIVEPQGDGDSFSEREQVSGFDDYQDTFSEEAYELSEISTNERSDLGTGKVPAEVYLGFDDRADTCDGDAYDIADVVTQESSIVFYDEDSGFDVGHEPDAGDGFAGSIAEIGEDSEFDGFVDMGDEPIGEAPAPEPVPEPEPEEPVAQPVIETELEEQPQEDTDENEVAFFSLLADGRTSADGVVHVDQRSRFSLYEVLAKALALYEEAQDDRDTYFSILKATGIREQARAPFTPIIKLVFGKEFDKTRITEYAAALSFASRQGQTSKTLSEFLDNYPGGIKGCVHAERIAKRKEKGIAGDVALESAKSKLRKQTAIGEIKLGQNIEDEFVLLLGRRGKAEGVVDIIKPLDEKNKFLDPIIKRSVKKT